MTNKKTSLEDVLKVIGQWEVDNDVTFIGSFGEFTGDEVTNDRIISFGPKEVVKIILEELNETFENETEDFINW